jgi:hypothetical protein
MTTHAYQLRPSSGEVRRFSGGFNRDFDVLVTSGEVVRVVHAEEVTEWRRTIRRLGREAGIKVRTTAHELTPEARALRVRWGSDDGGRTHVVVAHAPDLAARLVAEMGQDELFRRAREALESFLARTHSDHT